MVAWVSSITPGSPHSLSCMVRTRLMLRRLDSATFSIHYSLFKNCEMLDDMADMFFLLFLFGGVAGEGLLYRHVLPHVGYQYHHVAHL